MIYFAFNDLRLSIDWQIVSSHSNQNNAQCQFTVRQIINNNKNLDMKFSEHDAQNRKIGKSNNYDKTKTGQTHIKSNRHINSTFNIYVLRLNVTCIRAMIVIIRSTCIYTLTHILRKVHDLRRRHSILIS